MPLSKACVMLWKRWPGPTRSSTHFMILGSGVIPTRSFRMYCFRVVKSFLEVMVKSAARRRRLNP